MLNTAVIYAPLRQKNTSCNTSSLWTQYAHKISMEKKIPSIFNLKMKLKAISP